MLRRRRNRSATARSAELSTSLSRVTYRSRVASVMFAVSDWGRDNPN